MRSNNVIIYRDHLLQPSETFIQSQGEGLSGFNAYYVGSRKVNGIELPLDRSFFINTSGLLGKFKELLFKVFNYVTLSQLELIGSLKPLLIHAHFGPDGVLALALAKAFKLPLIVTFHGYDATINDEFAMKSFFIHRKYIRNRKDLIQYGSKFIAVSEFIKGKIIEQGFPEEKISVHYVGIDITVFQPLPQIIREPIVLFVGRLVEVKGCEFLIRAMQEVQESIPEAELVVIGDGPLKRQLEHKAESTLRNYRFLGVQPPNVVREWMNRAKVFSVPSITTKTGATEGFGIVFAEAQAMGIPVVSFESGGIPEAVLHKETGYLLPEKDWKGLAKHIILLFEDDTIWMRMSYAAQKRVYTKFNLRTQTKILEDIYMGLVQKSQRHHAIIDQAIQEH